MLEGRRRHEGLGNNLLILLHGVEDDHFQCLMYTSSSSSIHTLYSNANCKSANI